MDCDDGRQMAGKTLTWSSESQVMAIRILSSRFYKLRVAVDYIFG